MAETPALRPGSAKENLFTRIRNLPRWQGILAALPLGLLLIGGLIGGLIGVLGAVINLKIARTALAPAGKALSMTGVIFGAVIAFLLIAAVLAGF
ncbi:hypothetical protein ACIOC2_12720 [Streptomyces sp. NPDC088337]|uniref:hypothetical protein n=1 Tax=unclassified Streptomyces TaxID=2593676 RepID=UPI002DD8A782|nr:hypothetical protein [Streptomyces sp. NBC_01788]WSB29245.1 hypothetical protein OIE49_26960 [Streptomyces sp. NBC_01788]